MTCCRKRIDKEKLKTNVANAKQLAQIHGQAYKEYAQDLFANGKEWATPRAEKAWKETVKFTAPRLSLAANKVAPVLENAHTKLVQDYIPRIDSLTKEETMSNKTHKVRNIVLIFTGLVTAVVAGVLVWRRLQPVDDPWAEEYWEDFEEECGEDCDCAAVADEVVESEK
ncbi:hypothetical protein HCQ94_00070 [Actinomyces sp. zg-332]|uniref:hypothetical protein n=1 Tax=Actinomyces sp. zg-332 TaxID=2708340 RepID=UPI00141EFED1|nr:hypothetical protein [Actinomyces sp. zg-332]QPK94157.1 hypothetical protein HCQ94_00070 [Actinomyces sp. zg-332]